MSLNSKNIGNQLPSLEIQAANEIVADPTHAWHAIKGYDFAGLENILTDGLTPANNQENYAVCLSASPVVAQSVNREANSFYAYTLQDGLSLCVSTGDVAYPAGDHGGFVDELRRSSVGSSAIDGIMLPEHRATEPLVGIKTVHEPRKPKQAIAYVERTLKHLSELGVELDSDTLAQAQAAIVLSQQESYLDELQTQHLEQAFMCAYARFLKQSYGLQEPTVSDMLNVVLERTQRMSRVKVYGYSEQLKKEVGLVNAKISAKAMSHSNLGGISLSEWR